MQKKREKLGKFLGDTHKRYNTFSPRFWKEKFPPSLLCGCFCVCFTLCVCEEMCSRVRSLFCGEKNTREKFFFAEKRNKKSNNSLSFPPRFIFCSFLLSLFFCLSLLKRNFAWKSVCECFSLPHNSDSMPHNPDSNTTLSGF